MTDTIPTNGGYAGAAWLQTGGSQFNELDFMVRQIIAGKAFAAMVQVRSVQAGGTSQAGTVSVQPMIGQVDGLGNIIPHGTIYGMPYMRVQGGTNAVIIDPAVGDIGLAVICDRDTSIARATGAMAGPGSLRQNDWSDGMYIGGFLNGAPTQFVQFAAGGINITSPGTISLSAGGGTFIDGRKFLTHEHSGVTPGTGNTGGVV